MSQRSHPKVNRSDSPNYASLSHSAHTMHTRPQSPKVTLNNRFKAGRTDPLSRSTSRFVNQSQQRKSPFEGERLVIGILVYQHTLWFIMIEISATIRSKSLDTVFYPFYYSWWIIIFIYIFPFACFFNDIFFSFSIFMTFLYIIYEQPFLKYNINPWFVWYV